MQMGWFWAKTIMDPDLNPFLNDGFGSYLGPILIVPDLVQIRGLGSGFKTRYDLEDWVLVPKTILTSFHILCFIFGLKHGYISFDL